MKTERILGIDPGYGRVGWGVVERTPQNEWKHVAHGCIETSPRQKFLDRLVTIHAELKKLILEYQPGRMSVEQLFFFNNAKTAMAVGEARGVIVLTAVEAGLPVDEFTPLQVKQATTGYGRADKAQMQKVVGMILGLKTKITPDDAADALGVALASGQSLWMNSLKH